MLRERGRLILEILSIRQNQQVQKIQQPVRYQSINVQFAEEPSLIILILSSGSAQNVTVIMNTVTNIYLRTGTKSNKHNERRII